jgi:hypothetical protein
MSAPFCHVRHGSDDFMVSLMALFYGLALSVVDDEGGFHSVELVFGAAAMLSDVF